MKPALRIAELPIPAAEANDIEIDYGQPMARMPDGEYRAVLTHHETAFIFKTPKVFLWFRIVDAGEHHGALVYRAYRVQKLTDRAGRGGKFKLRRGSDFLEMLFRVLQVQRRPDRISLLGLRHCVLKIRTRTVDKDYRQKPLAESLRYSVVDDVLGKETN